MAVTSIWGIKDRVAQLINYAENPEKTENGKYVTGLLCDPENAKEQFMQTKEFHHKTGGNTAYHAIQSFAAGELSADTAHEIGVRLAERLWPGYEVIVATHCNTDCPHNHFVSAPIRGRVNPLSKRQA